MTHLISDGAYAAASIISDFPMTAHELKSCLEWDPTCPDFSDDTLMDWLVELVRLEAIYAVVHPLLRGGAVFTGFST